MRIIKFILLTILFVQASEADSQRWSNSQKRTNKLEMVIPLEQTIQRVDNLFDEFFDVAHPASTYDTTKVVISNFTKTVDKYLTQQLQKHYYENFYSASEKELLDSAIVNAFKYLLLDGRNDGSVMWQVLVENYASDADTDNALFLLNQMKAFSAQHDNAFNSIIESLEKKYNDVFHPKSFEEKVTGRWVSVTPFPNIESSWYKDPNPYQPQFILDISTVMKDNGITMLSSPSIGWRAKKYGGKNWHRVSIWKSKMPYSQTLNFIGDSQYLFARFSDETIKKPNTEAAKSGFESTRKTRAEMEATIYSSKASFGEKLAGQAITSLTTGLMDAFYSNMATGSKTSAVYGMCLTGISPDVLTGSISYERVKAYTNGRFKTERKIDDIPTTFVRWEESDSIIFIGSNGKPIFAGYSLPKDSPLLGEYNRVKRKHNFWQPQYLLPTLASAGVGTVMVINAIKILNKSFDERTDSEDVKVPISYYTNFIGGIILPTITISLVINTIDSKRQKVYNEINKRNMDYLKKKGTLNISPEYDFKENAIGFNMNYSF